MWETKGQQVAMPRRYKEDATYYGTDARYDRDPEPEQKEQCLNAKCLKYCLRVLIIMVVLGVFAGFSFLIQQNFEIRHEINALKRECQFDKWQRNGAAKEHDIGKNRNNSFRSFIEEFERIRERVQKLQPNKTTNTTKAFQDIKDHLNFLISSLGRNLSADSARVSRLRFELNATKNELTKTESNIDELWRHWNRTNAVVEDLTKLLTKQNETFHFKIAYHSDALYSEVKDVEMKQTKFQNETNKILKSLRNQLNTTRQNLEQRLDDKISRANKSWHRALEDSVKSARSTMEKINVKADGMKQELLTSIDKIKQQQSEFKNDLSKTKTDFQEKHRKHDSAISDQVSKTGRLEDRIAKLESERWSDTLTITSQKDKMQDLENRVEKIENGASGLLRTDIKQMFVLFIGWLIYYVLFN